MTGAIAGDIIGSVYEFDNIKTTDFPLFTDESDYTDDTIMTVAVADWLLNGGDLVKVMQRYSAEFWNDGKTDGCRNGGKEWTYGSYSCRQRIYRQG